MKLNASNFHKVFGCFMYILTYLLDGHPESYIRVLVSEHTLGMKSTNQSSGRGTQTWSPSTSHQLHFRAQYLPTQKRFLVAFSIIFFQYHAFYIYYYFQLKTSHEERDFQRRLRCFENYFWCFPIHDHNCVAQKDTIKVIFMLFAPFSENQ